MGTSDPSILAVRAAQADQIDTLDAERTALTLARDAAERDASDARTDRRDLLATYRDLTEAR